MDKQIIGTLAGVGTTVSFLPQLIRVVKTRSTKDLSVYMILIHFSGVSLWVAYGVLVHDFIIVGFNAVTFLFVLVILMFKLFVKDISSSNNNDNIV